MTRRLFGLVGGLFLIAGAARAADAPPSFTKDIAPDPSAQLRELPPARRRGADAARRATRTCARGLARSSSEPASARRPA